MNNHIVLSSVPWWSHIRPLCTLAAKIIAARPVTVTILVPHWGDNFVRVSAELKRTLLDERLLGEARVIAVGPLGTDPWMMVDVDPVPFELVWAKIVNEQPLTCSATSIEYPAICRPSFVVLDGLEYDWFSIVRRLSPALNILAWFPEFTGGLMRLVLPGSQGGLGDMLHSLSGRTKEELRAGISPKMEGKVTRFGESPPMYDWEHCPQIMPNTGLEVQYRLFKAASEADGLITTGAAAYHTQPTLDALSRWIDTEHPDRRRPSYHLGPLLPMIAGTSDLSPTSLKAELDATPGDIAQRVIEFLEQSLNNHGLHSVVYICFGSLVWPSNPDHLWLLIDKLADKGMPFILSHCSMFAQIPDRISSKYGVPNKIGLLCPWSPQQTILSHPACGWFVSHGGMCGSMESITQGVPMIGWPFCEDQPTNIAHCVHTLDIAYEFIEVRTGTLGLKPIYMKDGFVPVGTIEAFEREVDVILNAMQGADGMRKRENAKKVQESLKGAWARDGPAKTGLEALLNRFIQS